MKAIATTLNHLHDERDRAAGGYQHTPGEVTDLLNDALGEIDDLQSKCKRLEEKVISAWERRKKAVEALEGDTQ